MDMSPLVCAWDAKNTGAQTSVSLKGNHPLEKDCFELTNELGLALGLGLGLGLGLMNPSRIH